MSVARFAETECLACHHRLNALGDVGDDPANVPAPGVLIVCIACGAVMIASDDLSPRGMTQAEMDTLTADTETMDDLARHVKRVHLLKHSVG